jgi:RNA recognition motif-containing protein
MGKKLYVGNMSYSTTDESLREQFEQVGTVESAKVIIDRETNRSKGFAFVEMATNEEAEAAIAKFDGVSVEGRALRVSEAKPMEPRSGGGGGRSGGGYGGGGSRY